MDDEKLDRVISDEVLRERIRRLQPLGPREDRAAKFLRHPVVSLLLTFGLTTGAGQWIAYCYQTRASDNEARQAVLEARRDAGMSTLKDVGRLMDRRLFWSGEFWHAVKAGSPESTKSKLRTRFDSTVWAWRENYNTNAASICRIFGDSSSLKFAEVTQRLSNFGNLVRRAEVDSAFRKQQREWLDSLYDSTRSSILVFNMALVDAIRTGQIGEQVGPGCGVIAPSDTFRLRPRREWEAHP